MLVCTGRTLQLVEDLVPTAIITSTMWLVVQPSHKCLYTACYGLSHTVEFCSNYFRSIIKDGTISKTFARAKQLKVNGILYSKL